MYPFTKTKVCPEIQPELNKDGRVARVSVVDQFDGQDFMMGDNGFKRSDISAYMHADSESLRQAILDRMQQIDLPIGYSSDTPVGEIIDHIVPAYCKTSAQIREFIANIEDEAFDKVIAKYAPKQDDSAKQSISFDDTETPKSE